MVSEPKGKPPGTLRRRISSSPPQPPPVTFRAALLRSEITDSAAHKADLQSGGNPAGNQHCTHRHAPRFSGSLSSTRRHVGAPGSFSGDGTPQPRSSGAVLLLHPSGGRPRALLTYLFAHFASTAFCQSSSPWFGSFFFHLQFHSCDFKFHSRDFKLHSRDSPPSYYGTLQSKRDSISS